MTAQNRATLKALFEDGDIPTGSNYKDFIDSFVSLADTSAQSLSSKLTLDTMEVTGTVTAAAVRASAVTVSGAFTIDGTIVAEVSATATVSAVASANRWAKITVSGAAYFIPLHVVAT